jgi:hypothetical protein
VLAAAMLPDTHASTIAACSWAAADQARGSAM